MTTPSQTPSNSAIIHQKKKKKLLSARVKPSNTCAVAGTQKKKQYRAGKTGAHKTWRMLCYRQRLVKRLKDRFVL